MQDQEGGELAFEPHPFPPIGSNMESTACSVPPANAAHAGRKYGGKKSCSRACFAAVELVERTLTRDRMANGVANTSYSTRARLNAEILAARASAAMRVSCPFCLASREMFAGLIMQDAWKVQHPRRGEKWCNERSTPLRTVDGARNCVKPTPPVPSAVHRDMPVFMFRGSWEGRS